MIRLSLVLAAAMATVSASVGPVDAQGGVEAGMLQCRGGATTGFVVGSVSSFNCIFQPSYGGPPQPYVANIRRAGVDIGVTQEAVLGWVVIAPTRALGPGALAGGYGGVSAGAAFLIGAGANALIGGFDNSFALQPVSLEAQRGVNVTATITGLELAYVQPRPRHHHYHHHHHRHHRPS